MTRTAQIDYPHPYDDRSEQSKKETLIGSKCFHGSGALTPGQAHARSTPGTSPERHGEVQGEQLVIAADPPLWTVLFENVADGDYDLAIRRGRAEGS